MPPKPSTRVFKVNTVMTTLDLNANFIGYGGTKAISSSKSISTQVFKNNGVMTKLDLNANPIGDDGTKAITPSRSILD